MPAKKVREEITYVIDTVIDDFDAFVAKMEAKGYEIKDVSTTAIPTFKHVTFEKWFGGR